MGVSLLLGAFALVLIQAQVRAREDLEERFGLRSVIAGAFVSSWIDDFANRETADAAESLDSVDPDPKDFRRMVRSYGLVAAVLLDDRGRVLLLEPTNRELIGTKLSAQYEHLDRAVRGLTGVSNVVPSAVEGIPVVAVAVPFDTIAGRRVFSGAFAISETPIGKAYLENISPIVGSRVYLVDAFAKPFSTNLDAPDAVSEMDRDLFAAIRSGKTGTFEIDGDVASIEGVDGTPWRIAVVVPSEELFEPITGWTQWAPWFTFAALAAAVAVVWWLFEKVGRSGAALAQSNAELARRNSQVEEAAAAQRRFMSAASHQLRTPLTSILGYLELLPDASNEEERQHSLEVIERNAKRLFGLVDSLMLVFRSEVETYARDEIDFSRVVVESIEAAMPAASDKGIALELRGNPSSGTVRGDRERLGQVVDNLVSNAVKFSHEGGTVEVDLESDAYKVRMTVTDHGRGIPADEIGSLFERFFRTSTARGAQIKGTGLGLAITRSIIEKHGGHIDVSSAEGKDTVFTVELPVAERART